MYYGVDTSLIVNESMLLLTEGEMKEICVVLAYDEKSRQRDIQIQILMLPNSTTSGMCTFLLLHSLL